jgi:hypothetical protein
MIVEHYNGEELYLMINPQRDLFCLELRNFDFAVDWETLLCHLPFSCMFKGFRPLGHIAVEFDPAWNIGLPRDFDENWNYKDLHEDWNHEDWNPKTNLTISFNDLLEERSPRGFLARGIRECAVNAFHEDEHPFFWLIDRRIRRTKLSRRDAGFLPREFSDVNHNYIETTLGDTEDDTVEEYYQTAHHFVRQFELMAGGDLDNISLHLHYYGDDKDGFSFEVKDCLGVLACS